MDGFLQRLLRPLLPKYYIVLWHVLPPSIYRMSIYEHAERNKEVYVLATNLTYREAKALIAILPNEGRRPY